jgi:hypothetical protein
MTTPATTPGTRHIRTARRWLVRMAPASSWPSLLRSIVTAAATSTAGVAGRSRPPEPCRPEPCLPEPCRPEPCRPEPCRPEPCLPDCWRWPPEPDRGPRLPDELRPPPPPPLREPFPPEPPEPLEPPVRDAPPPPPRLPPLVLLVPSLDDEPDRFLFLLRFRLGEPPPLPKGRPADPSLPPELPEPPPEPVGPSEPFCSGGAMVEAV